MKVWNLKDKTEYVYEVMELELLEWGDKPNVQKTERIERKVKKYFENVEDKYFFKLVLIDEDNLVGFISLFPEDCDECPEFTPWYATMFVKKEYRGKGYSKVLNDALLKEVKNRGIEVVYLKTTLNNYYEKFGAKFVKELANGEKILKFNVG